MTKPLLIVSSKTGNTRIIAHAVADSLPDALLTTAEKLPEDLSGFNPVGLFFWCDRGMAPEDTKAVAPKLAGKKIACVATMGGDPKAERALEWMKKTSEALVAAAPGAELAGTFLCQGRIDPELFAHMSAMMGGEVSPEREARRKAAEHHPDRLDALNAAAAWQQFFN